MRGVMIVGGILVLLAGALFFLQGLNVIPVGAMAGDTKWVIIGLIMVIGGGTACYYGLRRKPVSPQS
jgi:hypothetical protein